MKGLPALLVFLKSNVDLLSIPEILDLTETLTREVRHRAEIQTYLDNE